MNIVLLGAPGAGKGTQAKLIHEAFDIPHLSAGDLLRRAVKDRTSQGKEAQGYMDRGELVPHEVIMAVMGSALTTYQDGFLLDGFPRSIQQAVELDNMTVLDAVLSINVDFDLLLERLTGRRSCPDCGSVFHAANNPPVHEGKCDSCNATLIQRTDDTAETVSGRIETYRKQTEPLIQFYEDKGILRHFDGNMRINEIFEDIRSFLRTVD